MPYPNYGIKVYKNGDYKAVNQYLRKIRGVPPTHLPNGMVLTHTQIEKLENIIRSIDSRMVPDVLSHFPVLYRGTGPDEFGKKTTDRLSSLIDGKTRRWKAYTSTSDIKRCAENYASGGNNAFSKRFFYRPQGLLRAEAYSNRAGNTFGTRHFIQNHRNKNRK